MNRNSPVVGTVSVGCGRINVVANQPREPPVSTKSEASTSPVTCIPTVGVQVAHNENVVCIPATPHSRVDVYQGFHLFHGVVRVCMDAYQDQLTHACNFCNTINDRRVSAITSVLRWVLLAAYL